MSNSMPKLQCFISGCTRRMISRSRGATYAKYGPREGQAATRIERVAGDHVVAAFSLGELGIAREGTTLRWIVDDGDERCPDCDDNALAGPLPRGERYPTGQAHPPAHSGCRCLLAPPPA